MGPGLLPFPQLGAQEGPVSWEKLRAPAPAALWGSVVWDAPTPSLEGTPEREGAGRAHG